MMSALSESGAEIEKSHFDDVMDFIEQKRLPFRDSGYEESRAEQFFNWLSERIDQPGIDANYLRDLSKDIKGNWKEICSLINPVLAKLRYFERGRVA